MVVIDYIYNYLIFFVFFCISIFLKIIISKYGKIDKNNLKNYSYVLIYDNPILSTIGIFVSIIDYIKEISIIIIIYSIFIIIYYIVAFLIRKYFLKII